MLKQGVAGNHQLVQNLLVAPILEHQAEDLLLPPGQVAGLHQFLQAPGLGLLLLGRLSLYRTRREGLFTEKEAFYLRVLANHINLAYARCLEQEERNRGRASPPELVQTYHLTPREGEILGLIFQDWNNEEILEKLRISRYTLLKHLQNIYRKCGVSSRWDLRKLGP